MLYFDMTKRTWTHEQLNKAVKESHSTREVLNKLGLKPAGGNYAQFRKYQSEYNIDISHFNGRGWSKGKTLGPKPNIPLSEILVQHSTYQSNQLRKRLIRENILPYQCDICKGTEWLDKPIPLELDHINGIRTDHRLENLRLLCPNCHAQTTNYRGKNKGTYLTQTL